MQAVVLVGGEGTRLRPLTLTQPKPAMALVDRPFIRYMVDWLGHHGVSEVVMACGFRAEDLRAALGDEAPGGPSIRYIEEPEPLGTAGPVRLVAEQGHLGERFMVLNGDVLSDLDLTALQRAHAETGAVITLALYPVEDPSSYGLVRRDRNSNRVLGFLEKPEPEQIDTDEISAGAYVVERSALDLIPPGRAVSIERQVFPRLVGHGLYGRRLEGYWMDIGTPERYLQASWDILEGTVRTDFEDTGGPYVDDDAEVAANATIEPRAVLGVGSRVGAGAAIAESVLLDGCRVGAGARVRGSILGPLAEIGERATVGPGAVVGRGARIAPGVALPEGARVQPDEVVEGEVTAV
jgi:mannose-1-phosphate guanylyltransferase